MTPAQEVCDDGLQDEDCDGEVNEADAQGCVCVPGETSDCADGPAAVGACAPGTTQCLPSGLGWGPCEGQVLPIPEECDGSLIDEDCDGLTNEEGDGCTCSADGPDGAESISCYSGPTGTEDVGDCHGGTRTCSADGLGYGSCAGEQSPRCQDCALNVDADCDGVPGCAGTVTAVIEFDGPGISSQEVRDIATAPDGALVVGGLFEQGLAFGGALVDLDKPDSQLNPFLLRIPPGSAEIQAAPIITSSVAWISSVAADAGGAVYATIVFHGTISLDLPGGLTNFSALPGPDLQDILVVKFNGATGLEPVWASHIDVDPAVPGSLDYQPEIAVGSSGVWVTGAIHQTTTIGSVQLAPEGGNDVFVARFDATTGAATGALVFGNASDDAAFGVTTVDDVAWITGSVDFTTDASPIVLNPGLAAETTLSTQGGRDAFIAKLSIDAAGVPSFVRARAFGGAQDGNSQEGRAIASVPGGDVVVAGFFTTSLFLGQSLPAYGNSDIFVARFDTHAADVWAESFGGSSPEDVEDVEVDCSGNILLAGKASGPSKLLPQWSGGYDFFFAKVDGKADAQGKHAILWTRSGGTPGNEYANGIAVRPLGGAVVGGAFSAGTIALGSFALSNDSLDLAYSDGFIVEVSP